MANPGGFISVLIAFIAFIIVIILFNRDFVIEMTWQMIILMLCGIMIFIMAAYNMIMGFAMCPEKKDKTGQVFGISIIFPIVAILIASIDKCRIPIASILQSFIDEQTETPEKIVGGKRNKTKGGNCCEKQIALSDIENEHPVIKGAAYGFYIFFGMLYAITYSNSVLSC